jgi:hypothetical protein
MSWQRRKGTDYENHVRDEYLLDVFPYCKRAPLSGVADAGDFINTRHFIMEAKKRNAWRLPEWIRVVAGKAARDKRPWMLWFAGDKRKGDDVLRDDFVVMTADTAVTLLSYVYDMVDGDPFDGLYGPHDV